MAGHSELLALLLPPLSYAPTGTALRAELSAEGKALDAALTNADRTQGAITPFFAEQLLPDWERVCAITPAASATYQLRLQAVLAKLGETGGLSIAYFTRLAASLGYTLNVLEPQPFRVGVNRAGDAIMSEDILWTWQVVVTSQSHSVRFRVGQSAAGERLTAFGDPVIESVFRELKPAHTFVYFAYQG